MHANKKVIILSYSSHNPNNSQTMAHLRACCLNSGFTIVKTLNPESVYDSSALYKLTNTILKEKEGITLVIDKTIYYSTNYLLHWGIIGTLQAVKLIDEVLVYQGYAPLEIKNPNSEQKPFKPFIQGEIDFLSVSAFYFNGIINSIELIVKKLGKGSIE